MFSKLLTSTNKPAAIIFCEKKFCAINDAINQYVKSIVSEQIPYNNQDENCKKIDNKTYRDLIILDGNKKIIKKEDISDIQKRFSFAPFEKCNKRIYILKNVDNSTIEAMNSLLKFIEEPPKATYAILTTKNISKVIPTIKSRCQIFYLSSDPKEFENKIKPFNIDKNKEKVVFNTYFDFDEFKNDYDNGIFDLYYNFVNELINNCDNLSKIKELSIEFTKLDYNEIKKILQFACVLIENKKIEISLIINSLSLYPTKILIFNKLWEMLDE